jgi:hypothetical protein
VKLTTDLRLVQGFPTDVPRQCVVRFLNGIVLVIVKSNMNRKKIMFSVVIK